MKNKLILLLLSSLVMACSASKKMTTDKEKSNQNFFKANSIYAELSENNYHNLYYFNSENNTVYFSKINMNDTLNKTSKPKLNVTIYGEYDVQGNTIKIKRYTEKTIRTTGLNVFQTIIFTFPFPTHKTKHEITVVDKEIITEGEIKKDTLLMNKMYFGTKKLNFEKKKTSKIHVTR